MKRNRLSCLLFILGLSLGGSQATYATVIIDPLAGWTGGFNWNDGIGQIDHINGLPDTDWSITADVDSRMSLATAYDWYIPGDEFTFVLDGTALAWDTTYTDDYGFFHGELFDVLLSAGTHLISINVTAIDSGSIAGGAFASFSGLTENFGPNDRIGVAEPATLLLMGMGLLGLLAFRQKPIFLRMQNI